MPLLVHGSPSLASGGHAQPRVYVPRNTVYDRARSLAGPLSSFLEQVAQPSVDIRLQSKIVDWRRFMDAPRVDGWISSGPQRRPWLASTTSEGKLVRPARGNFTGS